MAIGSLRIATKCDSTKMVNEVSPVGTPKAGALWAAGGAEGDAS